MQQILFADAPHKYVKPFSTQLLKWIGSKQRFAHEIVGSFPEHFGRYFEPFLGSGAVLATLAPQAALGSDNFSQLVDIWRTLRHEPSKLKEWYRERWAIAQARQSKRATNESRRPTTEAQMARIFYSSVALATAASSASGKRTVTCLLPAEFTSRSRQRALMLVWTSGMTG